MQIRVRYAKISTSYDISAASNVYEKTNRERNSDYGQSSDFTGDGYGKTMAALGEALIAAASGKRVVVIQFLKGRGLTDSTFERQLEPEIKIFRFEKSDADFLSLPEDKQREEAQNIRNGICFARKVLTTGQCDLLVLDEVLGLVDCGIVQEQELRELIFLRGADTDVTLTGIRMCDSLLGIADHVSDIEQIK